MTLLTPSGDHTRPPRAVGSRKSRVNQEAISRSVASGYQAVLKAGQIGDATPTSIEGIAARCNPFNPCREHTTWRHAVKGGKVRLIQQFLPIKRMMQGLVADIILAIHPPREEQYLFRGGIPAALKAAEAAYADGYTHAVEVDAVGFYHNVRHDVLAGLLLPLPAAVAHYVVCNSVIPLRHRRLPYLCVTPVLPPMPISAYPWVPVLLRLREK